MWAEVTQAVEQAATWADAIQVVEITMSADAIQVAEITMSADAIQVAEITMSADAIRAAVQAALETDLTVLLSLLIIPAVRDAAQALQVLWVPLVRQVLQVPPALPVLQ